ncbi:MAG: FKBP-type peptidyl-prolyl cis-trans isomerase [Nitrospirae bacterium]|nr:FKBP-type peptidyl-prolyl cis-trans isomerase [Nitrospirota bacterium]
MVFEFDVIGDANEEAEVDLALTINGQTYTEDKLHFEGDFGKVKTGKGRKIYWNVLQDFPRGLNTKFDWEIVATQRLISLPSGLQYKVIKEGSGDKPKVSDIVTVHFRVAHIDGNEFDSSYGREPATFPVNAVIPGWTEALQLMKIGSKWLLIVPPDLAYGERGAGREVGPNETLLYDLELLSIQKSADKL